MKLYTEEQVKNFLREYIYMREEIIEDMITNTLNPIEVPSDEDIRKKMFRYNITDFGQMSAFQVGAKWMKEEIQGGNK